MFGNDTNTTNTTDGECIEEWRELLINQQDLSTQLNPDYTRWYKYDKCDIANTIYCNVHTTIDMEFFDTCAQVGEATELVWDAIKDSPIWFEG